MDEKHIEKSKAVIDKLESLGEIANQIPDLENYETEAIDILFFIDKKSSVNYINKIMVDVLAQAFGLDLNLKTTIKYADKIKTIINNE